jgi:hypothetical protein
MSLFDALLGRTRLKKSNLDALFALPSAAVTLQAEAGLGPSGEGAVCFKPVTGQEFEALSRELEQLLQLDARDSGSGLREREDEYGYRWIVLTDPKLETLITGIHLVNSTLEERGFGPQLLCSVFGFRPAASTGGGAYLVYLYKRGTFYPFAPVGGEQRDGELELRLRGLLRSDLPIEEDLTRWFPLWGVPVS